MRLCTNLEPCLWDLTFSRRYGWRSCSSGLWRRVESAVDIKVSEKRSILSDPENGTAFFSENLYLPRGPQGVTTQKKTSSYVLLVPSVCGVWNIFFFCLTLLGKSLSGLQTVNGRPFLLNKMQALGASLSPLFYRVLNIFRFSSLCSVSEEVFMGPSVYVSLPLSFLRGTRQLTWPGVIFELTVAALGTVAIAGKKQWSQTTSSQQWSWIPFLSLFIFPVRLVYTFFHPWLSTKKLADVTASEHIGVLPWVLHSNTVLCRNSHLLSQISNTFFFFSFV
jgi:hypothetical protein